MHVQHNGRSSWAIQASGFKVAQGASGVKRSASIGAGNTAMCNRDLELEFAGFSGAARPCSEWAEFMEILA